MNLTIMKAAERIIKILKKVNKTEAVFLVIVSTFSANSKKNQGFIKD